MVSAVHLQGPLRLNGTHWTQLWGGGSQIQQVLLQMQSLASFPPYAVFAALLAFGLVTLGFEAFGLVTLGFEAFGLVALGFEAFGLVALGFVAFGLVVFGLVALGFETFGLAVFGAALAFTGFFALLGLLTFAFVAFGAFFGAVAAAIPPCKVCSSVHCCTREGRQQKSIAVTRTSAGAAAGLAAGFFAGVFCKQ